MPTEVKKEVSLEDATRALSDGLGTGYRVTAKTDSTLRVFRNPVIWGTVSMSWAGGKTTFRVRPGGFLLVGILNALYTVPKVHHVLRRAFPEAA
jgi:hypothetical protein